MRKTKHGILMRGSISRLSTSSLSCPRIIFSWRICYIFYNGHVQYLEYIAPQLENQRTSQLENPRTFELENQRTRDYLGPDEEHLIWRTGKHLSRRTGKYLSLIFFQVHQTYLIFVNFSHNCQKNFN